MAPPLVFLAGESFGALAYYLAIKDVEAQAHFGLKFGLFGVSLVQDSYYIGLEAQDPSRNALVDWLLPFVFPNQQDRWCHFYEALSKSGWMSMVEIEET